MKIYEKNTLINIWAASCFALSFEVCVAYKKSKSKREYSDD